ncbi:MAG: sugar phosphate isomerase/epimerase family protein [Bacteroidota bacterium]
MTLPKFEKRRSFLRRSAQAGAGLMLAPWMIQACGTDSKGGEEGTDTAETMDESTAAATALFSISLAEWSLHKAIRAGEYTNLDFPGLAKNEFGIDAIEYVSQLFKDKAEDMPYLTDLKQRCDDNGVQSLLIMVDNEGHLGDLDEAKRTEAIENHHKWVTAAKFLGCHSIRVNAAGEGTPEEVQKAAVDGLGRLSEFAKQHDINVIVENHGGWSSDGNWLAGVMSAINMDNCGTLPDFGNFCIERSEDGCANMFDRYEGVELLMPFAKAVSAKSHDFNEAGDEIHTDYMKMMQIVSKAGYSGYVGIEYEGSGMSEFEGIKATKALLEKVRSQMG